MTSRSSAAGTSRGFTLVELLVVLTIAGVMLAALPKLVTGSPGVRLRAAADDMAASLRQLHDAAIREETTAEFVLDPAARTYRLSTAAGARTLPAVVTGVGVTTIAFRPVGRTISILFYPDGSASGGTIRLRHGDLSAAVRVDWLTGRVTRDD